MTYRLVLTEDGSPTLKDEESGELYHNRAGAYLEALLNYVQPSAALKALDRHDSRLIVLDVCFGLGYNSFVLLEEALKHACTGSISLTAIEKNIELLHLLPEIISSGKFPFLEEILERNKRRGLAQLMCERRFRGGRNDFAFDMEIIEGTLQGQIQKIHDDFDLIFHDPFSPKRAPELWTADIFGMYQKLLRNRKGAVLTYSSASAVRGGLREVGFEVRKTTALGGKSGGTIAMISAESAHFSFLELGEDEAKKLDSVSGVPYRSKGFGMDRPSILRTRTEEQAQYKRLGKD